MGSDDREKFAEEKKAALLDIEESERALEVAHKIISDTDGYYNVALSELSRLQRVASTSVEASKRLKSRVNGWADLAKLLSGVQE